MTDTTNYGWTLPTVGGNTDTWGTVLNAALDAADASVKVVENAAPKKASNLSDLADASTARDNLGLTIDTDVQGYSAALDSIASAAADADKMLYATGADTYSTTALTSFARTLLDDTDASTMRATLGLATSAIVNTGTSGATIPLLNGNNTYSGTSDFTGTATHTAAVRLNYDTTLANDDEAGFLIAPQNTQNSDYTLVISDAGKTLLHTNSTGYAWTIPPNSSVAFPVGTVVVLANTGTGTITLTRGAGVALYIGGSTTSQDVDIDQNGFASLIKVATNGWLVQGSALS